MLRIPALQRNGVRVHDAGRVRLTPSPTVSSESRGTKQEQPCKQLGSLGKHGLAPCTHSYRSPAGYRPSIVTVTAGAKPGAPRAAEWNEQEAWEAEIHSACGKDDELIAALRRSLAGLHVLLPDLASHWQQLLGARQALADLEALLRGEAHQEKDGAAAESGQQLQHQQQAGPDVCLYADAQTVAQKLRAMSPFLLSFGAPDSRFYLQQSEWVLSEALMSAARNYCGPGSTLLRAADLELSAAAVRNLRRSHEAHLDAHIRAQLELAMMLPDASRQLVQMQLENSDSNMSVGQMVAAYPMMLLRAVRREPYPPPRGQ